MPERMIQETSMAAVRRAFFGEAATQLSEQFLALRALEELLRCKAHNEESCPLTDSMYGAAAILRALAEGIEDLEGFIRGEEKRSLPVERELYGKELRVAS